MDAQSGAITEVPGVYGFALGKGRVEDCEGAAGELDALFSESAFKIAASQTEGTAAHHRPQ